MIQFILEVVTPLFVGTVIGYAICAMMTMSSHSEQEAEIDHWRNEAIKWENKATRLEQGIDSAIGGH